MKGPDTAEGEAILKKRFSAHVVPSHRAYHTAVPQKYWNNYPNDPFSSSAINVQREQGIEVNLSESSYEDLCLAVRSMAFHPLHSWEREYIQELEFEAKVRDDNPGVKKAYDNYRLLMELVANGRRLIE